MKNKEKSSEVLAIQVIAYRAFGSDKDGAEEAMNELSKRRLAGDSFDFESFIEEKIKDFPVPQTNVNQLGLVFGLMNNFKNKV